MVAQISKPSCSLAAILLHLFPFVQGLNFPDSLAVECWVGDDAFEFWELAIVGPLDESKDGIDFLIDGVGVFVGALDEHVLRKGCLIVFLADGAIDDRREYVHVSTELGVA